jgi:hypothetical protein
LKIRLFVNYSIFKLGELAAVPAVGGADEVTGDSLELVDVGAAAVRTFFKSLFSVLETAVHAAVAVVVH